VEACRPQGVVGYPEWIDAPPASLLDLSEVTLRYPNDILALGGVSVRLAAGEFVSVVGPSGCGKSTLLHIAAGLTQPSSGVATRTAASVAYVFQDPTLLPWRSVARNVELLCELHRMPREQRRTRARVAIDRVGLSEFALHKPATLSGGMRMRASLARALTLEPDLFLFDEPFGALDELTRQRLGEQLLELFTLDRFGALLVTHSITEAVFLSTRVLVMSPRPGRVVAQIPVPIGYPRPAEVRFSSEFTTAAARVAQALRGTGYPAGDRTRGQDVPA
jgi:NitT/TauT family transport system ATP-binding protein